MGNLDTAWEFPRDHYSAKLMEAEPVIVPMVALAEMQHDGGQAAPLGPPAVTDDSWAQAAADEERGQKGDRLTIADRTGYELTQTEVVRAQSFSRSSGTDGSRGG